MKINPRNFTLIAFVLVALWLPLEAAAQYDGSQGLFGMGKSSADYEYSTGESLLRAGEPNTSGTITNDSFGAPLGSGIAILIAAGAGYAIVRRKRSRKNTMLLLACVALLGFTQCKKDQPQPQAQGEQVKIILNVDNGNTDSKVDVNTVTGQVTFRSGDVIHVVYNHAYIGTLTHNGTNFEGNLTITQSGDQPLYFYYFGNISPTIDNTNKTLTVDINNQRNKLPVISCAPSKEDFSSGRSAYSAKLQNKCALVKFTPNNIDSNIRMTGLKNRICFNFSDYSYSSWESSDGYIDLYKESSTESWAILLPQDATSSATAISVGYRKLTGINVPQITADAFITGAEAIAINLESIPTKAFSIGDEKYVVFAPGNLQATTHDGWATWTWGFKELQYNDEPNNTVVGENYAFRTSTSHFGWGSSGHGVTKPNYTEYDYSKYAQGATDITGTNYDWGRMVGTLNGHNDWRTLTANEWKWILGKNSNTTTTPGTDCRRSSTVNNVDNARYTMAQITIGNSTINGTILFPDDYKAGTPAGVTWGTINTPETENLWANTICTEEGWTALEEAGCVFLPAAGRHEKDGSGNYKIFGVGQKCYYWTTTKYGSSDSENASAVRIDNSSEKVMYYNSQCRRVLGDCVRLVREVN